MADLGQYDPIFQAAGEEWNVDPRLLKAMATQESGGDARAQSGAGAQGLMQIIPSTQKALGVTDPHDPAQSIYGGAKYMARALDAEKTPEDALRYYHGGPGWRGSYGPESRAYAPAVTAHYQRLAGAIAPRGTAARTGGVDVAGPGAPPASAVPTPAAPPASGTAVAESHDDFLKRTAGGAEADAGSPADRHAAFLARTGAKDAPEKPASSLAETPAVDEYGRPMATITPASMSKGLPTRDDVLGFLGPAPNTTYGDVVPIARDNATGALRPALPNFLRAPMIGLAEGPVQGATINPATGTLGITPEAQAVAGFGANPLRFGGGNPLAYVPPGTMERAPIPPEAAASMLNPNAAARIAAAEGRPVTVAPPAAVTPYAPAASTEAAAVSPTGVPVTPPSPAGPQSVGAAASRDMTAPGLLTERTSGQRVASLEKAVQQTAEERAGPQLRDDHAYVEGIPPRVMAARDFSHPVNALDHKVAYAKDTEFRQAVDAINRERNSGMDDLLKKDAGDGIALENAHEARAQFSPEALGVFKNETAVDGAGLLAKVEEHLTGAGAKRGAIRTVLEDVRRSLFDADGKLETMPSQLYGARQNVTDLLKKGAKGVGPEADNIRAAKSVLGDLLPEFDRTIGGGAPKYGTEYMPMWRKLSEPINQMEFLQQYQSGSKSLMRDGYLQPEKVQKMLDDVLQAHRARGVNNGKSLTDAQIQNIENVRNELYADKLRVRHAAVPGSDTFQQLNRPRLLSRGPVGAMVKGAGELAIGIPSLGTANLLYHTVIKPGREAKRAGRIAAGEAARKAELLAPPPNYLTPP